MPILKISNELSGVISTFSNKISNELQDNIDILVKNNDSFSLIYKNANSILLKNNYVLIKNIGFNKDKSLFEAFIKLFGSFYGESIEYADIRIECNYTACDYNLIELHNDDMIALEKMPNYGFIQVLKEDPLKLAKNGLVKILEVVNYLKYHDAELLEDLMSVKVPMMTYGINYNDANKEWTSLNETILYYSGKNDIHVRFDLGTIDTYYWQNKLEQPRKEKKMISDFLDTCKKFRKEFYIEQGDILIHNNKTTLHDRTQTAIELNLDGSFNSREIFVGFTKDYE